MISSVPSRLAAAWIPGALLGAIVMGPGPGPALAEGGGDLPKWEEGGLIAPPGGGLWPDDFNLEEALAAAGRAGAELKGDPQPEEDSWLRFLPRGLFSNKKAQEAVEPQLVNISDEALRAAENSGPDARLLDPQGVLTDAQAGEVGRLLDFHAGHAGVGARFLLLESRQQLAPEADLSRLASGEIVRGSGCLVVYPFGAPQRARLFLTRHVSKAVEPAYLEALAGACRREAAESSDPFEQLQRFATQLSIRLFWLERAYPSVKPETGVVTVATPVAAGPRTEDAVPAAVPLLSEVTASDAPTPIRDPAPGFWRRPWVPYAGAGLAALILGALLTRSLLRWRRRRIRQTVWLLPDYDHRHALRFGGPHCGGNGAAIKYG